MQVCRLIVRAYKARVTLPLYRPYCLVEDEGCLRGGMKRQVLRERYRPQTAARPRLCGLYCTNLGGELMDKIISASAAIRTATLALASLLAFVAHAQDPEWYFCDSAIKASTPASDFTVHGDGTVTHTKTGLMWMASALPGEYTWLQALTEAGAATHAGYSDWRLPNIKELASIVEFRCHSPAINLSIFPDTPSGVNDIEKSVFWSSSTNADGTYPFAVDFRVGLINDRDYFRKVRLVRD